MTVLTRTNLKAEADTVINDNTAGDVSPADVRGLVKDLADSATFPEDLGSLSPFTGDSGAGGAAGTVPAPAIGDAKKSLLGGGAFGSPITESSTQPTADVAASSSLAVTGLNIFKRVDARWFFELLNTSTAATRTVTISARVSGGTKRTIVALTTPSLSSFASGIGKCLFYGELSISGMNEAREKIVKFVWGFSGDASTIDSSNAINNADTTTGQRQEFFTWDEVWDEISIDLGANLALAGSTADERGRLYTYGYP